jgi:hypothetical protein
MFYSFSKSNDFYFHDDMNMEVKYDKQDQHGKTAFNERNPHTTQQQEPWQGAKADSK